MTGVGFGPLSQLPIEYLDLSQSPVTDEGLEQIARLRRLKYLGLEKSDITDAGMAHLAALHGLEDLRLSVTDISDAGLTSLEKLSRLKSLSLLSTKVSAEGVARLASALPKCEIHHDFGLGETPDEQLLFADSEPITKATLEAKLKHLGIDHSVTVDTNHPDQPITSVWLSRTTLSNRPLLQLVRGIPQLETLSLHNTFAGDELLPGLKESSQLRILVLRGGRFTPAGLESLHEVESLRELELHQMPLTDNDVEHLRGLSQLESLFIEGSRISSEGARALRKHLPGCRVTVR